jgi:hypothetical protein
MGNNKDPNKKRPGEKESGTFHYNPGNMSGKTASRRKDPSAKPSNDNKNQIPRKEDQQRR